MAGETEFAIGATVSCVSAVTGVGAGIRVNITKQQVENLPPVHNG